MDLYSCDSIDQITNSRIEFAIWDKTSLKIRGQILQYWLFNSSVQVKKLVGCWVFVDFHHFEITKFKFLYLYISYLLDIVPI